MRLVVQFLDRVGIAQEILAVLARKQVNLAAVEIDPPHLYIDAPTLEARELEDLRRDLLQLNDVVEISEVNFLPGTRRRLQLDALLAAMPDPVFAVDGDGVISAANAAAAEVTGVSQAALQGLSLGELTGDPGLQGELIKSGFKLPVREVMLRGKPFMLEATPVDETTSPGDQVAGGVVALQSPRRVGDRLQALQSFPGEGGFDAIIGDSPPMHVLKARAARVAAVEAPLLIRGETGTGKELVARACHTASSRRSAPFLALNCAAMPESLAESELFGYASGAFTGAHRGGRPGLLEMANNGTIFLDEIGEMSPYLQAKLLRFLNDGRFRRVGGDRELHVDVRVISATHRDLEAMVAGKLFREDLFYRLNVLSLDVPPLRERGEDILLLARHFLERACAQVQRPTCRLTAAAGSVLLSNAWPGNVRQLHNVIFRAATMSDQSVLDVADLELAGSGNVSEASFGDGREVVSWRKLISDYEKSVLERLFPLYPSSRKLAAHLKTSHTLIANKLRKYRVMKKV